ncbi:MAG: nitronate monooxygenase [Proteobacteria bacterium]|nr:nitronate monooxygenase [Pseudomonadota bacterium]
MFSTRITELFGIEYPIIQGAMMGVARAELAAEVSNAGGLGLISALAFSTPEELAQEIRTARELTTRPFGVNVTLLPISGDINYDPYFDVIENEGIRIVETAGRIPELYMDRLKLAGISVMHKCNSVSTAKSAQKLGCDAVSIDGFEGSCHQGDQDVGSLVLIPATVDALKIPVVASGGIADGRGLVAALALGADGIGMSTRFLMTEEAPVHPVIKGWLMNAYEHDTLLILRSIKKTMRVLESPVSKRIFQMEKRGLGIEDLTSLTSVEEQRQLLETGAFDTGVIKMGQTIGLIKDAPPVKHLIDAIIEQAKDIALKLK